MLKVEPMRQLTGTVCGAITASGWRSWVIISRLPSCYTCVWIAVTSRFFSPFLPIPLSQSPLFRKGPASKLCSDSSAFIVHTTSAHTTGNSEIISSSEVLSLQVTVINRVDHTGDTKFGYSLTLWDNTLRAAQFPIPLVGQQHQSKWNWLKEAAY